MPEIGATLREARMRQHSDISEGEPQAKIRSKYLRALENEEWDLLPGNTFVKTFLRTYAEALGLDARLLLEEYKLRYERLSDADLLPISPQTARDRERAAARRGRGRGGRPQATRHRGLDPVDDDHDGGDAHPHHDDRPPHGVQADHRELRARPA